VSVEEERSLEVARYWEQAAKEHCELADEYEAAALAHERTARRWKWWTWAAVATNLAMGVWNLVGALRG